MGAADILSFPFLVATIVDSTPIVVDTQQFIFEVEHLSMSRFLEERNSSFKRRPFSDSPMSRRLLTSDLEPGTPSEGDGTRSATGFGLPAPGRQVADSRKESVQVDARWLAVAALEFPAWNDFTLRLCDSCWRFFRPRHVRSFEFCQVRSGENTVRTTLRCLRKNTA